MKLKTLKDINNEADDGYCTCGAYEGRIKQEAIKWVKFFDYTMKKGKENSKLGGCIK